MKAKQASENAGLFQSWFLALMIWSTFDGKHVKQTASILGRFTLLFVFIRLYTFVLFGKTYARARARVCVCVSVSVCLCACAVCVCVRACVFACVPQNTGY